MNHMIIFIFLGFFAAAGLILRTKAKLEQIKKRANRLQLIGFLLTLSSMAGLFYFIVFYKTGFLFVDLVAFFSSACVTLVCFMLASR